MLESILSGPRCKYPNTENRITRVSNNPSVNVDHGIDSEIARRQTCTLCPKIKRSCRQLHERKGARNRSFYLGCRSIIRPNKEQLLRE